MKIFSVPGLNFLNSKRIMVLGLLPHGQLDPPLWSTRGIGKIFPWPAKGRRRLLSSVLETNEDHPIDYVFRVVNKGNHADFRKLKYSLLKP